MKRSWLDFSIGMNNLPIFREVEGYSVFGGIQRRDFGHLYRRNVEATGYNETHCEQCGFSYPCPAATHLHLLRIISICSHPLTPPHDLWAPTTFLLLVSPSPLTTWIGLSQVAGTGGCVYGLSPPHTRPWPRRGKNTEDRLPVSRFDTIRAHYTLY